MGTNQFYWIGSSTTIFSRLKLTLWSNLTPKEFECEIEIYFRLCILFIYFWLRFTFSSVLTYLFTNKFFVTEEVLALISEKFFRELALNNVNSELRLMRTCHTLKLTRLLKLRHGRLRYRLELTKADGDRLAITRVLSLTWVRFFLPTTFFFHF